jgi:hypothetical protein
MQGKEEKRNGARKRMALTTVVRKPLSHRGNVIMEFMSRDLAEGGIFILTEDLSLFDLGEELEILIDDAGRRYYEGRAKVVRSARIFSDRMERLESGFGLMFQAPGEDIRRMLGEGLQAAPD